MERSALHQPLLWGTRIEPKHFFLKLFGHPRDIPAKSRDIPPKKFGFPGFEGHTELFGPHPFVWKTPTPPENIRAQKFRFGFVFPKLSRKIPSFSQNDFENFSAVDTQTAVLVSTAEVWISAPDTQTHIFLGILGIHSWLWFFCREPKIFGYFLEVPVTKIRVSAPARFQNPTVIKCQFWGLKCSCCRQGKKKEEKIKISGLSELCLK